MLGVACSSSAGRPATILLTGPAMIVVAPATSSAEDRNSEAYGDYAEYLNGFAMNRPAGLRLVRLSLARYKQLFRQPVISKSYATIVLRRTGQAMIYSDMVLEPQVYQAGARWALGGSVPAAELGLKTVRLVRRR